MRYSFKTTQERMQTVLENQKLIDTTPVDVDKKAFTLRPQRHEKQIAHSTFRTRAVTEIDRLNNQYEDDLRVLDCEVMNAMPKKRFSMAEATKLYHKKIEKEKYEMGM